MLAGRLLLLLNAVFFFFFFFFLCVCVCVCVLSPGEIYPEEDGTEPEWVTSEKAQFNEQRDTNKDGKLDKVRISFYSS